MFKEPTVSFAKIVLMSWQKTVARTLTMTGKEETASPATLAKSAQLGPRKTLLLLAVHHLYNRVLTNIAQQMFWKHEMIANVQ